MERLQYDSYGGPEVVHLAPYSLPALKSDELLVRVAAAAINPMDWKLRSGDMKLFTGSKFPRGVGSEFSGIVEAVGGTVSRFQPGDAVLGSIPMKQAGAFAPLVITQEKYLVIKPPSLSFAAAATLPIAAVTAWLALTKTTQLRQGQKLFVNGALGAVGQAAIAIAKNIGAAVAGRVAPDSFAQAQSLGLYPVLDYSNPIPAPFEHSFDVVFDCHGSLSLQQAEQLIRSRGKIVHIAINGAKMLRSLTSFAHKVLINNPIAENLQPVVDLAAAGKLTIPVVQRASLLESPALLAAVEQGKRLHGKAVITP
jgi:NADPH:quinone reductase-like Zn-dependent oxidoreductase